MWSGVHRRDLHTPAYGRAVPYRTAVALSRTEWAEAGLEALAGEGLAGVAVEPLARRLKATKGSFYWHFTGRSELITATLELWERRDTIEVIAGLRAVPDPRERLVALARYAYGEAARGTDAQAGVLASAADRRVAPFLARVTRTRLEFLEQLFGELGRDAADARRRAHLAYALYLGLGDLRRAVPGLPVAGADLDRSVELMVDALVPSARARE